MSYLIGIDIGGTFTDFVAYDRETKTIRVWKNLSTPSEPIDGVLVGLSEIDPPSRIEYVRLGTTVATNALLERKGATVGYIATKGHRDVPFIQRGNRRFNFDFSWVKPKPYCKRRHAYELNERLNAGGEVLTPLDEDEVVALARRIAEEGEIDALAVNLLFSYISPAHEQRVRDIFATELPGMPVSISFDVLPKWKEYERASTTLADAYIKPIVGRQLSRMRGQFEAAGITGHVVVIKSNGGEATLESAAATPINLAVSGPTGGVIACRETARLLGIANLVTLDMGGTSTDVSTIVDGREKFTTEFEIEWGRPIQVPMIDIRTLGAGGGSLAWTDKAGLLRVGPQSAGALPGPACYGRGGQQATVTDANLVLGRINPQNFLGGAMELHSDASFRAIEAVAAKIGRPVEDTALFIVRIVNNNMVGALREVLVEQGLDPRDFTLLAFGGAGPLHLSDLMVEANIGVGLVPNHPGQFSAYGFTMTDARVDRHRTIHLHSRRFDADRATQVMQELVDGAVADLAEQGYSRDLLVRRVLEMRYSGQNYELEVTLDVPRFDAAAAPALWEAFHAQHKDRFGFRIDGEPIEIVTFKATVTAPTDKPELPTLPKASSPAKPVGRRRVVFEGHAGDTPVFERALLAAGHAVSGPAIIEEAASVTVVRPGHVAKVDRHGNIHLSS